MVVTVLVGEAAIVGIEVGVSGGLRVGNLISTVGVGVRGGRGVAVGTSVLVGVGSAGVGVAGWAVGNKLNGVGVGVNVGGSGIGVSVGVGGKKRS